MIAKTHIARLEKEGFKVNPDLNTLCNKSINGVILSDGTFILCEGFNQHLWVYPLLKSMGLVNASDWIDDDSAIHVSSGQLNGKVANSIEDNYHDHELVTKAQLDTLFAMRKVIDGSYGDNTKVVEMLYEYICRAEDFGGKWNGLKFLQRFYTNIHTPQIQKNFYSNSSCIRTSPKYSLPGLLNSKFNIQENSVDQLIKEIEQDFEKAKDVRKGNKLHYFFQQQIDGINGVCHVRGREREFSYAASEAQGDIVQGKKGKVVLNKEVLSELKSIATELAIDFDKSIQLEFVVSKDKLYVVQLRVLQNEPEETVGLMVPDKALVFGKTFSHGSIDVNVKDILVVSKDGDSSLLLGKKALIVTNNVEFSHLLALSKALRIPSMYATGKVKLPNKGKVKFVAYNKKSWIL